LTACVPTLPLRSSSLLPQLALTLPLAQRHLTYGPFIPPQKASVPLWLAVHLKKKRRCRIVAPSWLRVGASPSLPLALLVSARSRLTRRPHAGELEEVLREEQTRAEFSDLPRDYLEVSKVLLEVCVPPALPASSTAHTSSLTCLSRSASDDVPAPDRVRLLLKDIREARQAKVREGLAAINAVHLGVRPRLPPLLVVHVPKHRPLTPRLVVSPALARPQMPNLSTLELSELRPFFSLAFTRLRDLDPQAEAHREAEEYWMRDPAGCMDAARRGEVGGKRDGAGFGAGGRGARGDREETEMSGF